MMLLKNLRRDDGVGNTRFIFEAEKYDVSVKIGERVLLPAVRSAAPDTLIITDGFSCYLIPRMR